ncbi:DUF933 domain-containing protein [Candidatus Sumerlaeota bacterium]
MNIGLVGLPRSGKTTVFQALVGPDTIGPIRPNQPHRAVVNVPDPRVQALTDLYQSKKVVAATIQYIDLPGVPVEQADRQGLPEEHLRQLGQVDALLAVIGAFEARAATPLDIDAQLESIHLELLLSDMQKTENRLEKARKTVMKVVGAEKQALQNELAVLERVHAALNDNTAIRELELRDQEQKITRGFQFLSEKPILYLANIGEESLADTEQALKPLAAHAARPRAMSGWICAQVELELALLSGEDRQTFMADYGIESLAAQRLIRRCYELMDYITFFTSAEKETHAWTVTRGTKAPHAAGVIHSDFERGFVRAAAVSVDDLIDCGSTAAARKAAKLRLEGKGYSIQDGDVIEFLFSV